MDSFGDRYGSPSYVQFIPRKQPLERVMQRSLGSAIPVLTLAINLPGAGKVGFKGKSTQLSFTGVQYFSSNVKLIWNYDKICRARAFYIPNYLVSLNLSIDVYKILFWSLTWTTLVWEAKEALSMADASCEAAIWLAFSTCGSDMQCISILVLNLYMISHLCTCIYIYICMYVCMYACMYVHVCTCMYMYVHVCTCIFVFVCVYVYVYVCMYVHIYIYCTCIFDCFWMENSRLQMTTCP